MKGWLELAQRCELRDTEECVLFPQPGDAVTSEPFSLALVCVEGRDCRRPE